jgi:RimJ/RimL family protein N-acetyltransferase
MNSPYPHNFNAGGKPLSIRLLARDDATALEAFAQRLPLHDLLFLARDIRNPRVIAAWLDQAESGQISSLLAVDDQGIHACTALVRDEFSWSHHVAEIRVLIDPALRGTGLGKVLAAECVEMARESGVEKLFVRLTPDQAGALKLFEDMGFRPEALLRDHVRDANGETHDILIMAQNMSRHEAQHQVYGMGGD